MAEELVFGLKEQDSGLWLTKWDVDKVSLWEKKAGEVGQKKGIQTRF